MTHQLPAPAKATALYAQEPITEALCRIQENYQKRLHALSHELKNTLSLTWLSLQLIQEMHPEVTQFHYWPEALNDMEYVCRMLSEHSLYEASAAGTPCQFPLIPFLQEITAAARVWTEHSRRQVLFCPPTEELSVYADPLRLRQILSNLIKNGLEAVADDGWVRLEVRREKGKLFLSVSDNGPGIPKSVQATLFQPYATSKETGTGLGLFTSRKMAQAMGGTLNWESSQGQGTVFTLCIPDASGPDRTEAPAQIRSACRPDGPRC